MTIEQLYSGVLSSTMVFNKEYDGNFLYIEFVVNNRHISSMYQNVLLNNTSLLGVCTQDRYTWFKFLQDKINMMQYNLGADKVNIFQIK